MDLSPRPLTRIMSAEKCVSRALYSEVLILCGPGSQTSPEDPILTLRGGRIFAPPEPPVRLVQGQATFPLR
jgi:hypothetical protein